MSQLLAFGSNSSTGDPRGPSSQVLVVDDDPMLREVVDLILADEGYGVMTAPNGRAALDVIGQRRPDLILLDWRMPVMDGQACYSACRRLLGQSVPIVVFTAAGDGSETAERLGADGVLHKPFQLEDLLDLVGTLTSKS